MPVTLAWVMTCRLATGHAYQRWTYRWRGVALARSQAYEITFAGQAGSTLQAEFDDCEVSVGPDATILRAELPDQAALAGLVLRITGLGLELIDVRRLPSPASD
jgi:hypothetical protein